MEDKIILDKDTFKALASDTRLDILKLLSQRQYTLTEMSSFLNLSNSTIKEHLDVLCESGLIIQKDEGRKWKYYFLTTKGRNFIQPKEVKVLFAFVVSLIGALGAGVKFIKDFSFGTVAKTQAFAAKTVPQASREMNAFASDAVMGVAEAGAAEAASEAVMNQAPVVIETISPISQVLNLLNNPIISLLLFVLFFGASTFFLGIYFRKPKILIETNK